MIERMESWLLGPGILVHILFIVLVLPAAHLVVSQIRRSSRRMSDTPLGRRMAKTRTIVSLATSMIVFAL